MSWILSQTPFATDYYSTILNNLKIREDMIFSIQFESSKISFILVLRKHECTMTQSIKRPYGITIIAILAIVGGMVLIFGGLSSLVSGAFFAVIPIEDVMTQLQQQEKVQQQTQNLAELHDLIQLLGSSSVVLGTVVMVIGIGYLIVSYGLLKGREWAWTITVVLTTISVVVQIVFIITTSMLNASLNHDTNTSLYHLVDQVIGITINGVILYYLYRPSVKTYFKNPTPHEQFKNKK
jgi:Predicted membrane protein (DUF2127)